MSVNTHELELPSTIPPSKMFKGLVLDGDTLIPKVLPLVFKSVETLEGDGSTGTIKLVTFGEESPYKWVKTNIDAIDKMNFTYNYTIIEGDALINMFESISYQVKIIASPNGRSIYKCRTTCITKGDYHVTKENIQSDKAKQTEIFKAIEAYLLAHPNYS
ncbi:hypothetical protein Acr_22g0008410 [Actinidia rufa]|uniref:Bet v I/Major latex protein domain-containing protein n=1 Tax=Actinidia rufa TaxID=165716 RepID=A0A7J0D8U4_9ERIC|nr:hypothetical protein Acr_00g0007070 [Actinidia rufa]GFZ11443.1 hypothetical protein Acr_22g0008410 [Actinidia rufa]